MLIGWGICGAIWLTAAAEIRGTVPQMVRTIYRRRFMWKLVFEHQFSITNFAKTGSDKN
jgi:hypothetical protein